MSDVFDSLSPAAPLPARRRRPLRVMLVEADGDRASAIRRMVLPAPRPGLSPAGATSRPLEWVSAPSLAIARQRVAEKPVDLVVLGEQLPDGAGLKLAEEWARQRRAMPTIALVREPSAELAIRAMRLGVSDLVTWSLEAGAPDELFQRMTDVLQRQARERGRMARVRRLRRLCRKLHDARMDVSRQVDVLCHDLVTAYQELAVKVQQAAPPSGYADRVSGDLAIDSVLRKTLQYLIEEAGPTSAAVFLPAMLDEFALGGYVNQDLPPEAAEMQWQHLADVLAPQVARHDEQVLLRDASARTAWLGDDALGFADREVLAFACPAGGEALAVVVLFRAAGQPFDEAFLATCRSVAPQLGEVLARIVRVHHRHLSA